MKKINEEFLHFLWKNQHLTGVTLTCVGDFTLKVLDPGITNYDAGPDFFNARISINNTTWAGNIELHINASDWLKHGHANDPAYDTVILHVVYFNDTEICRSNGGKISTAILRFPIILWDNYGKLQENKNWIPCQEKLNSLQYIHFAQWTSKLMVDKLEEKTKLLHLHMKDLHSHWDAILCRYLLRSFGLPVNTAPFEMLALLCPYQLLLRNAEQTYDLESILFGLAGFFEHPLPYDKYSEGLKTNFVKFKAKLDGKHVPSYLWKFMRMRPSSFPSLRIAQFASFFHEAFPMHHKLISLPSIKELKELFQIKASDYWNTHYQLGKESTYKKKYLGNQFITKIISNGIVPYLFFFGHINKEPNICDHAIQLLEDLPPENNAILKNWSKFGIECKNAFESQAILYLYKHYCNYKRCLDCQFGNCLIIHEKI